MDQAYLSETLALVNAARMAFGKDILTELPDARPGVSADCLYYRALADCGVVRVGGNSMIFDDERRASYIANLWGTTAQGATVRSPQNIQGVIGAFDGNKLSHYNTKEESHF